MRTRFAWNLICAQAVLHSEKRFASAIQRWLPPVVKLSREFFYAGGFADGQIILLPRVVTQIVKLRRFAWDVARIRRDEFPPALNHPAMLQTACWIVHISDVMGVLLAEDAATACDGTTVGQVNARQISRRGSFQQRGQRRP